MPFNPIDLISINSIHFQVNDRNWLCANYTLTRISCYSSNTPTPHRSSESSNFMVIVPVSDDRKDQEKYLSSQRLSDTTSTFHLHFLFVVATLSESSRQQQQQQYVGAPQQQHMKYKQEQQQPTPTTRKNTNNSQNNTTTSSRYRNPGTSNATTIARIWTQECST